MSKLRKISSAIVILALFLSSNFCSVECVFSSEDHDHSEKTNSAVSHHHESGKSQDSDSEKHDAGSLCCSSLVAVHSSLNDLTSVKLTRDLFSHFTVLEKFLLQEGDRSKYEIEFPPGASPPGVFLLTHFTHAPPVFL